MLCARFGILTTCTTTISFFFSFLFFFFFLEFGGFQSSFIFMYLFLALLGLHCCTRAFSNCGEQGLLFVAVRGLLIAVASLVAELGL